MLEIGNKAPDFCAPNQDDVEICSRDLDGNWIVLYFYPKDLTPGCTTQACDFTTAHLEFDDLDAVILGVSPDDTAKHRKFIEAEKWYPKTNQIKQSDVSSLVHRFSI